MDVDVQRLKRIINATLTINETYNNLEVVLQKILRSLEFVLECEAVAYMECGAHDGELICRVASGAYAHMAGLKFAKNQRSIAHKVLQNKKAVIINNHSDIQSSISSDELYDHYKNITSVLAFPLFDNSKHCFGFLEIYNKKNGVNFTKEDFELCSLLSQQIEQSICNASYVDFLTTKVQTIQNEVLAPFQLVYASKEMGVKLTLAQKISQSEAPILLTGESGVGKRLLARQIHKWNTALNGLPMVVSCLELVKATQGNVEHLHTLLFGHNKTNYSTGLFFQSEHETIIFSEISIFPLRIQAAILQYFKYKSVSYNSEKTHVESHKRVIFTSSQDLETMVSEGTFLEELYFHINALHISIAPLHKRPDDIVAIAQHYFHKYIDEFQKDITHVDPEVYLLLKKYGWPHSVRELVEVVYRSTLHCKGRIITRDDVAFHAHVETSYNNEVSHTTTLKEAMDSFKRQYIYQALLSNNWSYTKTARILQIQRSYLSRLVKNLNLKNTNNAGVVL